MTGSNETSPSGPDRATHLAMERTRVAYERTMMAWIRTATSLITFGFSVYKFFELEMKRTLMGPGAIGSRGFGLALIGVGLLSLLLGTLEHGRDLRALGRDYPGMPRSSSRWLAIVIAVLGLFALAAVIVRA